MILGLAVAVVLSQAPVKKVEIIRGGTTKKAPKTETSITIAPSTELDAKSAELNQRADELKAKETASEARREQDAKARAAQQKIAQKHARDLQAEYEKAANALAGQE